MKCKHVSLCTKISGLWVVFLTIYMYLSKLKCCSEPKGGFCYSTLGIQTATDIHCSVIMQGSGANVWYLVGSLWKCWHKFSEIRFFQQCRLSSLSAPFLLSSYSPPGIAHQCLIVSRPMGLRWGPYSPLPPLIMLQPALFCVISWDCFYFLIFLAYIWVFINGWWHNTGFRCPWFFLGTNTPT